MVVDDVLMVVEIKYNDGGGGCNNDNGGRYDDSRNCQGSSLDTGCN